MELHYVGISAAFDPYAQARPVGRCAECGAALYDGDRVYYGRGTDHVLGCGQCIDAGFAREEQGGTRWSHLTFRRFTGLTHMPLAQY